MKRALIVFVGALLLVGGASAWARSFANLCSETPMNKYPETC